MVRKSLRRTLAERQPWERPAEDRQGDGDFYPPGTSEVNYPFIFGAEKRRIDDPSDDADGRGRGGWPDLVPMEPTDSDQAEVRRRILEEGATGGIERLAWYQSYRSAADWGIHIREEAVIGVGAVFAAEAARLRAWETRQAALNLLLAHEYFHFLVDVAAETLEDVLGTRLYSPWRFDIGRRTPPYHLVEEALANAFAYRYGKTRGLAIASRRFLRNSPVGYRDFQRYLDPDRWTAGVRELFWDIEGVGTRGSPRPEELPWGREGFIDLHREVVSPWDVPVWLVREPTAPVFLSLITALGSVDRSPRYREQLRKLPERVREQVERAVETACSGVTPKSFKRLAGHDNLYRVRSGDYRIIMEQRGDEFIAVGVGHRSTVYRAL